MKTERPRNGDAAKGLRLAGIALAAALLLGACMQKEAPGAQSFVGRWHSSKAQASILMDDKGEWELQAADGGVTQYGVWQFFDGKLMWSVMLDGGSHHDVNVVLSATREQFTLREANGAVTTFTRLD